MTSVASNEVRSLKSLKDEIREDIWFSAEAENLRRQHDNQFIEGLAEIQKWCETLKQHQINVIEFCKTYHRNGMTVVPAPRGVIRRVYTVADDNWGNPVYYSQRKWPEPEGHAGRFRNMMMPLENGVGKLPVGFSYANCSTDFKFGTKKFFHRSHQGIWAVHDGNIYISPWIQSNEVVVIEWAGIKTSSEWSDGDLVSAAVDFKKTLKLYVQYAHERDYGDPEKAEFFHNAEMTGSYDEALADLMWQCRQETMVRETDVATHPYRYSYIDKILGARPIPRIPEPDKNLVVFAHIGNNGSGSPDALNVANLVKMWYPKFIVASGGNVFVDPNTGDYTTYDFSVGSLFSNYLSPYIGSYSVESPQKNMFWPTLDNSDWSNSDLVPFQQFFTLPNNQRYYDLCIGPVHLFFVDGSASDPDGVLPTSVQGSWLQTMLMLSTSKWKVVIVSQPPFSSDPASQDTTLQWPFAAWGADLVLSGEAMCYERFNVVRFPYIVNGLGGKSAILPGTQAANSMALYAGSFGAGRVSVNGDTLRYEFFTVEGTLIDTLELTKGVCTMSAPIPSPSAVTGNSNLLTGPWPNPNGNIVPPQPGNAAIYVQDGVGTTTEWRWSVTNQTWFTVGASSANEDVVYINDPNVEGLTPSNPQLPCTAYSSSGSGSFFGWNVAQQLWK